MDEDTVIKMVKMCSELGDDLNAKQNVYFSKCLKHFYLLGCNDTMSDVKTNIDQIQDEMKLALDSLNKEHLDDIKKDLEKLP